jgi:hypothetical protein
MYIHGLVWDKVFAEWQIFAQSGRTAVNSERLGRQELTFVLQQGRRHLKVQRLDASQGDQMILLKVAKNVAQSLPVCQN